MKPAVFEIFRPDSISDALSLLAEHAADAKVLAGGQSLVPVMNFRLATPSVLIDLNRVADLSGIRIDHSVIRIGAMTRQRELLESPTIMAAAPLLAEAASHIGHAQTRSRGTIGGSLSHADPAAELPAVMVALNAALTLMRHDRTRTISAREFFTDAMTTALDPDELLTEIAIPVAPSNLRCSFQEYARRRGDFAIVSVAAQLTGKDLTVVVGGLEAVPRYCGKLIEALRSAHYDIAELPRLIDDDLTSAFPLGDLQASTEYRRHLARILLQDTLTDILSS